MHYEERICTCRAGGLSNFLRVEAGGEDEYEEMMMDD